MLSWLTVLVVAATLALILIRPGGLSEAWFALAGALAMLAAGAVGFNGIRSVIDQTGGVLLFLFGMMVLTELVERAGIFDWLAEGCARLAGGSGRLLFVNIFVLGAIVTALLSLDVTVIMLTPVVYALAARRRLDPLPFMFACAFVANTASLFLPISNLTNLLLYAPLHLGFARFAARMWITALVAVVVNLLLFLWIFRERIPGRYDDAMSGSLPAADRWFACCAAILALTLAGLLALGFLGLPLAWASLSGAAILLLAAVGNRRAALLDIARGVSWPLFVFVIGMFVVVRGFSAVWLSRVDHLSPHNSLSAVLIGAGGGAIGSNIVNNVPMTVFAISLIQRVASAYRPVMAYATLIGVNVGPTLTTYGSMATILWLTLVRRRGLEIPTRSYLRVSLIAMPLVLACSTFTFWLTTR